MVSIILNIVKENTMGEIAIVIGATGLVGGVLVEQLAEANHISRVVSVTRRPVEYAGSKIENQVVDFDNLDDVASVFKGDLLFSCLGTTRRQAGSLEAQRMVDLEYQYKVAQLAASQGVQHYLLVSSSGARANSRSAYLQMKGELEKRVRPMPFKRISIFQPSLLMGQRPELRFGEKLGSLILPLLTAIPGLHRYRPIRGEQVAAKMVQVSQQPGQPLEWFTLDEIFIK